MSSSQARVLVTGASGYLASHVVLQLQEAGHVVRGTVRSVQDKVKVSHLHGLCPVAKQPLQLVEADLLKDETWPAAVSEMEYVFHVASPLPLESPRDENEVIQPAVEGTLNVLKACAKTGTVKRLILTSSCMAVYGMAEDSKRHLTEEDWSDVNRCEAYAKSKTLAERAAWDFVNSLPDEEKFEMAVLNPVLILGPPLQGNQCASVEIIQQLLERKTPLIPHLNLPIVDVRDVAYAHVQAMTSPEAAGHRHLCSAGNLWVNEIATLLKAVFGSQGYNVPTTLAPKAIIWVASLFDRRAKTLLSHIDNVHSYDNTRMKTVLQVTPREIRDTVVQMAYAMIEAGFVKKTDKYRGPGGEEERQMYLKLPLS